MQPAPAHPVGAVPVLPVALEAQLAALAAALASGGSLRIGTGWVGRTGSLSLTLLSSRIGNGNGFAALVLPGGFNAGSVPPALKLVARRFQVSNLMCGGRWV